MRLLVDESTGKKISELLKSAGHDTLFVGDIIKGYMTRMSLPRQRTKEES